MWDMRVATSSIPSDVLHKMLLARRATGRTSSSEKRIARFFIQAERFKEAREELGGHPRRLSGQHGSEGAIGPDDPFAAATRRGAVARRCKLRRAAGQHDLVLATLKGFPSDDVSGETLQAVRELIQEYEAMAARRQRAVAEIAALVKKTKEPATRREVEPLEKEIAPELGFDTLDRMAAFLQNADDAEISGEDSSRWPSAVCCWAPTRRRRN